MKIKMGDSVVTKKEKETEKFAYKFAKTLKDGDIVLLSGDLGAGKTVFAKGFVRGLGEKNADVVSPTFTIVNDYGGKIFHFDLYRLGSAAEFEAAGLHEVLYGDGYKLVEWPEKIGFDYFSGEVYLVSIEKLDEKTRKICVDKKVE